MTLHQRVSHELIKTNRSLSWLSREMAMTVDGLRASLKRESLKYRDIVSMAKILELQVAVLFEGAPNLGYPAKPESQPNQNEIITLLKALLKDKERIIELLSRSK